MVPDRKEGKGDCIQQTPHECRSQTCQIAVLIRRAGTVPQQFAQGGLYVNTQQNASYEYSN